MPFSIPGWGSWCKQSHLKRKGRTHHCTNCKRDFSTRSAWWNHIYSL